MSEQPSWHDEDAFWELFGPMLFDQERKSSAKAEVDSLVSLLGVQKHHRILDLACGIGRHSLELARRGFDVVGVDRTASFIAKAEGQAEEEDLQVEFVLGDMREYFQPNRFNIVVNLFGSFGYFEDPEDDRLVLQNMHGSLRSGGKLLIETAGKEVVARGFQERTWSEGDDTLLLAERKPIDHWNRIRTRWIVIKGDQRFEHTVSVRCFSAEELSSLVGECGFVDVTVYGDLEGHDYDLEAKRLVVVGTR